MTEEKKRKHRLLRIPMEEQYERHPVGNVMARFLPPPEVLIDVETGLISGLHLVNEMTLEEALRRYPQSERLIRKAAASSPTPPLIWDGLKRQPQPNPPSSAGCSKPEPQE